MHNWDDLRFCLALFRCGTMTDAGTSASPYVSWDELELKRKHAILEFEDLAEE